MQEPTSTHQAAGVSRDEPVTLPIMFGDGRVRRTGYEFIKRILAPNSVIPEMIQLKERVLASRERLPETERLFQAEKYRRAIALTDMLYVEAVEALAGYGNYWPKPGEPKQGDHRILEGYERHITLDEETVLGLLDYGEGLRDDDQREMLDRLMRAVDDLTRLARLQRRGTARD